MARRAVILESPEPKPRRAVVVRQGPPQRGRRMWLDATIGVVGVLLLVLTVALFSLLPQEEPVIPQFEVSFEETHMDDPAGQETPLAIGDSQDFAFAYEGGNLYRVSATVEWVDDIPASLPDTFRLELLDPSGEVVAGPLERSNPEPDVDGASTPPGYTARPSRVTIDAQLAARPSTQVVDGDSPATTLEEVEAQVQEDYRRGGDGDWTLRITMVEAGGCPDPSGLDLNRYLACQQQTQEQSPGGEDSGNPIRVVLVTFTKYDPVVQRL